MIPIPEAERLYSRGEWIAFVESGEQLEKMLKCIRSTVKTKMEIIIDNVNQWKGKNEIKTECIDS